MTTVTVPCSMPVGTGLKPAAVTRLTTSCGSAVVARSISATGSPMSALRTAPPTTRASSPSLSSTPSRRGNAPAESQAAPLSERVVAPPVI